MQVLSPERQEVSSLSKNVANKNFLVKGIEAFGYRSFKTWENCQAECRSCRSVIVESRGTTSGFVRQYFDFFSFVPFVILFVIHAYIQIYIQTNIHTYIHTYTYI